MSRAGQLGSHLPPVRASLLEALRGGIIVSCQAYSGEPLRVEGAMPLMAQAVEAGGAVAVRLDGPDDVRAGASTLSVPVIGIWKDPEQAVAITGTLKRAAAIAEAGATIVAVDGTRRARPDGGTLRDTCDALHERYGVLVMADCSDVDDGVAAEAAGADIIGTTLAGYVGTRPRDEGPDVELVEELARRCSAPIFAEGRIRTPADVRAVLAAGAFSVCVGTAITHPTTITSWFVAEARRAATSGQRRGVV